MVYALDDARASQTPSLERTFPKYVCFLLLKSGSVFLPSPLLERVEIVPPLNIFGVVFERMQSITQKVQEEEALAQWEAAMKPPPPRFFGSSALRVNDGDSVRFQDPKTGAFLAMDGNGRFYWEDVDKDYQTHFYVVRDRWRIEGSGEPFEHGQRFCLYQKRGPQPSQSGKQINDLLKSIQVPGFSFSRVTTADFDSFEGVQWVTQWDVNQSQEWHRNNSFNIHKAINFRWYGDPALFANVSIESYNGNGKVSLVKKGDASLTSLWVEVHEIFTLSTHSDEFETQKKLDRFKALDQKVYADFVKNFAGVEARLRPAMIRAFAMENESAFQDLLTELEMAEKASQEKPPIEGTASILEPGGLQGSFLGTPGYDATKGFERTGGSLRETIQEDAKAVSTTPPAPVAKAPSKEVMDVSWQNVLIYGVPISIGIYLLLQMGRS